ncbi:hypothetical protein ENSA5_12590 [Enhygromyxa salina]|uniref:Uncharacterized protein n=1 Tax=Enhygromyxa salina TaxID=215803 RepID=A0A2S9YF71_9BACT|nr:hypothetical protein ENSA5_12590 [Enhygromyxa salina]
MQPIQVPPPLTHRITNPIHIHRLRLHRREPNHPQRIPKHLQPRDPFNPLPNHPPRLQDPPRSLQIPTPPHRLHRGPASRADPPRPTPRERRRKVDPPRPVRQRKPLVTPQVLVPIQHHRGPLRRIPILVRIRRDRRHPLDPKIKLGDRIPQLTRPGQHEPAQASIRMKPNLARKRDRRQLRDRINYPMRKGRRRPNQADRVPIDRLLHGPNIRPKVIANRDLPQLDAKVLRGLVKRRVRRHRRDDVRLVVALLRPRPIAVGLHRHQDRLGPPRAHRPAHLRARPGLLRPEHVRRHRDDLGLILGDARPQIRVQRVGLTVNGVGLLEEAHVVRVAVVHGPRHVALLPARHLALMQVSHLREDLVTAASVLGQRHAARKLLAVGLRRLAQLDHHLVVLGRDPVAEEGQLLGPLEQRPGDALARVP